MIQLTIRKYSEVKELFFNYFVYAQDVFREFLRIGKLFV